MSGWPPGIGRPGTQEIGTQTIPSAAKSSRLHESAQVRQEWLRRELEAAEVADAVPPPRPETTPAVRGLIALPLTTKAGSPPKAGSPTRNHWNAFGARTEGAAELSPQTVWRQRQQEQASMQAQAAPQLPEWLEWLMALLQPPPQPPPTQGRPRRQWTRPPPPSQQPPSTLPQPQPPRESACCRRARIGPGVHVEASSGRHLRPAIEAY